MKKRIEIIRKFSNSYIHRTTLCVNIKEYYQNNSLLSESLGKAKCTNVFILRPRVYMEAIGTQLRVGMVYVEQNIYYIITTHTMHLILTVVVTINHSSL